MPTKAMRQAHLDGILANIAGRERKILHLEVANEAWQNGFPGSTGIADLREFAQYLADRRACRSPSPQTMTPATPALLLSTAAARQI